MNKYQDKLDQNGITQELVRELFDYDGDKGILIRKSFKNGKRKPVGHKPIHSQGYGQVRIGGKMYFTHRIIWLWNFGELPEFIDHLDRDRMNNRLDNLRTATKQQNNHNHGLHGNNSTGFPGVSWHKPAKKYKAEISINNKNLYLGLFAAAEDAFLAYQLAKIELHPSSPIAQEYYRELTLAG